MEKFPLYLEKDRLFSNTKKAIDLQDKSKFGELKDGKVIYSSFESLYLLEKNLINILKYNKQVSESDFIKTCSKKDKDFYLKYIVYKYLKNKGYLVKTGVKFGEEFRVYVKSTPNHAKWIVFPLKQSTKIDPKEFISKVRVTHSTGKKLLLAIVDQEQDITFYEIDWIKP